MSREETRYSLGEIEAASGVRKSTLTTRRRRYGIPTNHSGYTLDEVKRMIKRPPKRVLGYSVRKAEKLKELLRTDGAI